MSEIRVSRGACGSILSSLGTLGASQPAVPTESVARSKILGTLAAAGASLAAASSAEAGIVVYNPDANIGFADGNIGNFSFNIASLSGGPLRLKTLGGENHVLAFNGGGPNAQFKTGGFSTAVHLPSGKKFSTIGGGSFNLHTRNGNVAVRTDGGASTGPDFSDQYYAFTFTDTSSETHYGWMYGSLSGGYSDLSYNLISYAYDTTANEVIETGQTMSGGVPEPSTLVMGAMAALVLGAAGVRRWKKDQEAKASVVGPCPKSAARLECGSLLPL